MAKTPKQKIVSKKHLARIEREKIQNRNILIVSVAILVTIIGLIGYGILNETFLKLRQPVAKVGSDVVTAREFITMVKYSRYQMIQRYQQTQQLAQYFGDNENIQAQLAQYEYSLGGDATIVGGEVLDQMISELLIKQEAKRRGITVSKAEIDAEVAAVFGFFPEGTPTVTITPTEVITPTFSATQLAVVTITPTPTEAPTSTPAPTETPDPAVPTPTTAAATEVPTPEPTPTPYTEEGFKGAIDTFLTSVETLDFSRSDLARIVENQLLRRKLFEVMTADLEPVGEQVWARHILVADEVTANDIWVRVTSGEDFAALAAQFSTDESNNIKGGDLGWFTRGMMVKEFEDAAFALEVGAISQPVVTQNGYHIIQVIDHQTLPLNATQFQTLKDNTFNDWLTKAKEDSTDIVKYDRWMEITPNEPAMPVK